MIQCVERLETELEVFVLCEVEVLQQRSVQVENSRTDQCVATHVAVRSKRLQNEGRRVEVLLRGAVRDIVRADTGCIRTVKPGSRVRPILAVRHSDGEP